MKFNPKSVAFISIVLLFLVTACNIPFLSGKDSGTKSNQQGEPQIIIVPSGEEQNTTGGEDSQIPLTDNKVNPNPVGLQDGLGSLDSYKLSIHLKTSDEKGSLNEITSTVERSTVDETSHGVTTITTFDAEEDDEIDTQSTETFTVNNATCTYSDDEYSYQELSSQDQEMRDIFTSMIDFIPLIEDPVFVGEETMNDILCNHFTFKLNGIGDKSGSIATVNDGEYWLAVDGQYIVRYSLKLEVRSAAEGTEGAEVSIIKSLVDLTNVNVPITVTLPAGCFSAE